MEDSIQNEVKEEVAEVIHNPRNIFQEALRAILECLGIESPCGNIVITLDKKEDKAGETSCQQPDSTVEQPIDEEQKADETSCQQPADSTMEKPIDPPISTTDPTDNSSFTTDQPVDDFANEAATLRVGRAPPRPGIVGSTPQTNDIPS